MPSDDSSGGSARLNVLVQVTLVVAMSVAVAASLTQFVVVAAILYTLAILLSFFQFELNRTLTSGGERTDG